MKELWLQLTAVPPVCVAVFAVLGWIAGNGIVAVGILIRVGRAAKHDPATTDDAARDGGAL